jgi:hypothetical protein
VQPAIDIFQAPDEIQHFTAAVRATGGGAKVSATSKRPCRIDSTTLIAGIQEWAAPVGRLFQSLTAASSPCTRSKQRFTSRNVRNLTRKFEPATIGSRETETFDRPVCELFVDRFDFSKQRGLFLHRKQLAFSHWFLVPRRYPISQQ